MKEIDCSLCSMPNCNSRNQSAKDDCILKQIKVSDDENIMNAAEKTTRTFYNIDILNGDFLSLSEAQGSVNEDSKRIAIKAFVTGAIWQREKMIKDSHLCVVGKIGGRAWINTDKEFDQYLLNFNDLDKVRVLVIKED